MSKCHQKRACKASPGRLKKVAIIMTSVKIILNMPARNSIKTYVGNGYYHVYNRGVEKRKIFLCKHDYAVFLGYLKEYLLQKDDQKLRHKLVDINLSAEERNKVAKLLRLNNFAEEIELFSFTLKPNHFHMLIKQKDAGSMDKFMNSLCTRYTMYFNKKYDRVGKLFQGVYKAVLVDSLEYCLYLTKYIHAQSLQGRTKRPSSLDAYLGKQRIGWINTEMILSYFSKKIHGLSYESFVSDGNMPSSRNFSELLID